MTVYTVTQIGCPSSIGCEGVFSTFQKAMYHIFKWCEEEHTAMNVATDILGGPFPLYIYTSECKWEIEEFTIDEEG